MRAYVMATGIIFGLLAVAHVWRMIAEAPRLATDPFYLAITLVAGALGVWAAVLLRRSRAA
ncbi:MAG: hypothetical protein JWM27_1179 [Gemmatimonadetes bacterium]|nr:hypothetical protein [Gemmatimonadota bacterium]